VRAADGVKGLETVRTDWTPLAQQFQQDALSAHFRNEPYQEYVRETIDKLMAVSWMIGWSTASACAVRWLITSVTPPHVRAARLADEENVKRGARRSIKTGAPSNMSGPPGPGTC
jgi:DNA polymerase-2